VEGGEVFVEFDGKYIQRFTCWGAGGKVGGYDVRGGEILSCSRGCDGTYLVRRTCVSRNEEYRRSRWLWCVEFMNNSLATCE